MINTENSSLVILLSGIALFLYGMNLASHSLEKIMASRITEVLNRIGKNQFYAIVIGISLTTLMQSSGAVISMLVGLGSARVITLKQVMGVIIGTAVGTTLTVQLISFHLFSYALPLFTIGFVIFFRSTRPLVKEFGIVLIGFSFLFLGQRFISVASTSLFNNPLLSEFFTELKNNSAYSLIASTLICALVQSSSMTIAFAMSLAQIGAISLNDAILWIFGANIGTTATALFAAGNSNNIGRQVAWAHFFYKTVSVIIFYPLSHFFGDLVTYANFTTSRAIANAQLIFNIASAIVFFPFIKKGSQFIENLFPPRKEDQFGVEFVGLENYQSSALATSYANREIMRTADLVQLMLRDSIKMFETPDAIHIQNIKENDNKVDFLYRETKMFLLNKSTKSGEIVQQNIMNMIMFLTDLERAADAIDINLVTLALKKNALHLEFSTEGWNELKLMHSEICKLATVAINAFQAPELCDEALQLKRAIAKTETVFREHHIERLNRGMASSIKTSSIHLDILSEYRRIGSLLTNHVYTKIKVQQ